MAGGASRPSRIISTAMVFWEISSARGISWRASTVATPGAVLEADGLAQQRILYERHMAPIFDKAFLRWLIRQPASLYGLGIPPSQYRSLSRDLPDGIAAVLAPTAREARLRLRHQDQLLRLASLRAPLCDDRRRSAAALSAAAAFRHPARARRARASPTGFADRDFSRKARPRASTAMSSSTRRTG